MIPTNGVTISGTFGPFSVVEVFANGRRYSKSFVLLVLVPFTDRRVSLQWQLVFIDESV